MGSLLPEISNFKPWKETESLEAGKGTNKRGDTDATTSVGATWHNLTAGTDSSLLTTLLT